MSQNETQKSDGFDALFGAAKSADPVPSADLMARILADARDVQAVPVQSMPRVAPRRFGDVWADLFGGWAGATALAACVCLGMIVGFTSPDAVLSYVPGADLAALDDGFDLYLESEL